jgi:hypothetical protein
MQAVKGIAQALTKLCINKANEIGETMISLHSAEIMYDARHVMKNSDLKKSVCSTNIMG